MNCTPKVRQYDKLEITKGVSYMPERKPRKTYSGEFKQNVVETMRRDHLSYRDAARQFGITGKDMVANWERTYLEEGAAGLSVRRHMRATSPSIEKKPKLDKKFEDDLVAENQRLRAEVDYLKKLNALVDERVRREKKLKS